MGNGTQCLCNILAGEAARCIIGDVQMANRESYVNYNSVCLLVILSVKQYILEYDERRF